MLPGPASETVANAELAGGEVDQRSPEPECFALTQSEGEGDRPAGRVPLLAGHREQPSGFLDGQRLDLLVVEAGGLAIIATFRVTCLRFTASLREARRVRWAWCTVPAARPERIIRP